jgi:hypothetical protein
MLRIGRLRPGSTGSPAVKMGGTGSARTDPPAAASPAAASPNPMIEKRNALAFRFFTIEIISQG